MAIASPSIDARWSAGITLPHVLALALVLRLAALSVPSLAHPDELFQYLETAHRLVFGYGVVTWEWRYGMRGWLMPLLVAAPMWVGSRLAPSTGLYLLLPKLLMTLGSLALVAVAWKLGERLSRAHAAAAASIVAIWYETVLFAPHILSETVSTLLFLPAALLLVDAARWTPARIVAAGALLGLAAAVRFQHLPAIATLVMACCARRPGQAWRPLMLGALGGLAVSALCDTAMGHVPFAWFVENVRLNLLHDRAAAFGVSGPAGYLEDFWLRWNIWAAPLLALAALGARRYPALAWAAVVNVAFHCAIAHKEYRFLLLSITLTIMLAGIGSADWINARDQDTARRRSLIMLVGWCLASVTLAIGPCRILWNVSAPELRLYARLRSDPTLCGLAVYRHNVFGTGSYTYLHRDVPIEVYTDREPGPRQPDLAGHAVEVNTVLAVPTFGGELPRGFVPLACDGAGSDRVCLFRRPGGCVDATTSPFAIQRVLARFDR